MLRTKMFLAFCLGGVSACSVVPFALAPGAAQVRVTNLAADVAGCTPVGNIQMPRDPNGLVSNGHHLGQLRNQAIGFGGNAAFVTEGTLTYPEAGIAYQCPNLLGSP